MMSGWNCMPTQGIWRPNLKYIYSIVARRYLEASMVIIIRAQYRLPGPPPTTPCGFALTIQKLHYPWTTTGLPGPGNVLLIGTLCCHFANKQALGLAVVREIIGENLREEWIIPLEKRADPLAMLNEILQHKQQTMTKMDIHLGCDLSNLIQEMSLIDEAFRNLCPAYCMDSRSLSSPMLSSMICLPARSVITRVATPQQAGSAQTITG